MKEDYQKTLKNLAWVFPLHPVPFYQQDYKTQKGPGTSYKSLFGWQNIIWRNPFLVIYHQGNFDDLTLSSFLIIPKITIVNLCKLVQCHNYFSFVWPYESGNCGKEGKNYKKLNISRTKRAF